MYTINGINVATILKEQWKNDLIDNTIKLVYNSKLDKETKILAQYKLIDKIWILQKYKIE